MKKKLPAFPWQELPEKIVIGVDEVGRGCLAGPVYAAAAVLSEGTDLSGIVDSKTTSEVKRKTLAKMIQVQHKVCVAQSSVSEIEELNILQASLLAMERAVTGLGYKPEECHVLVDGNFKIPGLGNNYKQTSLIKGDSRATPIAAASIVAKVARDEHLLELAREYPQYGLEKHKGYCTKVHKSAIEQYGPAPIHRKTFKGVKEFL